LFYLAFAVLKGVSAKAIYTYVAPTLKEKTKSRVSLYSVECFEHGANSAIYINPYGSGI